MKKAFLICALFIAAISTASAQKIELGVKTGYNSTTFNTSNYNSYTYTQAKDEFKGGYLIGGYSRFGLIGNISIQPEFYYAKKSGATNFGSTRENLTYSSWDLPILAHAKLIDLKFINLYGVAGPVASFKSGSKTSVSTTSLTYSGDKFSNTNWNLQFGAGVQVLKLSVDVRYEMGLNDMSETTLTRKSNTVIFSLGYRLFGI